MRPTARKTLKIIDLPPPTVELRLAVGVVGVCRSVLLGNICKTKGVNICFAEHKAEADGLSGKCLQIIFGFPFYFLVGRVTENNVTALQAILRKGFSCRILYLDLNAAYCRG